MLKRKLKDLLKNTEDKAGLYITIIFHLVVIIVLLASQLDSALKKEESFVLDFSKQEEVERLKKEEAFKENISRRLDELIAASRNSSEPLRNIAVDAGSKLKDDRNTDADQLYKDAERLAKELRDGQSELENLFEKPQRCSKCATLKTKAEIDAINEANGIH